MDEKELISQLFKTEYRKINAVLCKLFGLVHTEIAEDITTNTFLLATETWPIKGIPENPVAWLYAVAKNKTRDYLKRDQLFSDKISTELKQQSIALEELEIDLSAPHIQDSQLQMLFTLCHPSIAAEAQIGLALRILCGFSIDEIADAFLTNKETINKRLFRAKEKLRDIQIKIELPAEKDIEERLEIVLTTLYLLFNAGYYSSSQNALLRKELCLEAMRLNYFLLENESTNTPIANALMSLMCFHASRFDARTNALGEMVVYDAQNKDLWDAELIAKGNHYLITSAKGNEISKYHLEATIAYWHATKIENENKWEHILQAYNQLLLIDYSPIVAMNRTYALAQTQGKKKAITEAIKINLSNNHFYHILLGHLYTGIDNKIALLHYSKALELSKNDNEKSIINTNIEQLK